MIYTTLNKIRAWDPSANDFVNLLEVLGKTRSDDEPLALVKILEINGLEEAIWALRTTDCDREARLFAVACARQVQHLMKDQRSLDVLDAVERYLNGEATEEEVYAAWSAAALADTNDAAKAARATAWADASDAAWAAAKAARAAASDATKEKQAELFKQIFG
jgi:hypothetical protein